MSSLDSEKALHAYINVLAPPSNQRFKYYRLNPQLEQPAPSLDQVEHMAEIRDRALSLISNDNRIQSLASHLIATLFYFEVTKVVPESLNGIAVRGKLDCDFCY